MKYITSALVLVALMGTQEVNAIKINQKAAFTDDLVKSLAEEMQKDIEDDGSKGEKGEQPAADKPAAAQAAHAPHAAAQHKQVKANESGNASNASLAAKTKKPAGKPVALAAQKKKAEEEDIPMDAAAIKAYSSVIADAAEDSEPAVPVQYNALADFAADGQAPVASDGKMIGADPTGSMIQNEISSIKIASIKAATDE